nr:hypothetical protein BaRGS_029664 [Batillaria attramentaria]
MGFDTMMIASKTFDTPLHEIIGSHVHLPGRYRTEFVNLKDVLGMRTGLSNMDIMATAMGMNRYRLMQSLRFAPEVASFREENVFSEALFPLAEDAARALGGDTWGQEIIAAASSVCASASDMAKWISFILNMGKNQNNEQVVADDALMSTFRSVQTRNGDDTRTAGFSQPTIQVSYTRDSNALGWIKGHYRGYPFISQDGSLPGYETLTTILPKRNVGVFTAFTGDGGARAYAAKTLTNIFALDLLLHGQPWFDANSVCNTMDKMVDVTMASEERPSYVGRTSEAVRPLNEYEGTYRNFGFGDLTVRRNESGQLRLEYGELGRWTLYPSQRNDTFIMKADQGPLWYTTHADEYRTKEPYLATFTNRYRDSSRRIDSVIVPHFARDMDPEFSKNPTVPQRLDDELPPESDQTPTSGDEAKHVWILSNGYELQKTR